MIRFTIPGDPHAQGRGRAGLIPKKGGGFVTGVASGRPIIKVRDPKGSSTWKREAQAVMGHVLRTSGAAPFTVETPIRVRVVAVFPCPASDHRKTQPRPRRWCAKAKDADNIGKAVLDAGNAVLWQDDRAVAHLEVYKIIGAQGEMPRTIVEVECLTELDLHQLSAWVAGVDATGRPAAEQPAAAATAEVR